MRMILLLAPYNEIGEGFGQRISVGTQPGDVGSSRVSRTGTTSHQVTHLLQRVRAGEQDALDELMPIVYGELRRIARAFMRRQQPGHTLQPTALVNEAFIKLFQDAQPQLADRAHFLALMSRVMRQVLVDYARGRGAAKRGGGGARVAWDTNIEMPAAGGDEHIKLLEVDRALESLARADASLAQVVEMHYFGGMTAEEAAVAAGRSVHVVRHQLRVARAWLRRELAR
jgi:RNA polymerase sigma factor (TIGR02999 family)